MEVKRSHDAGEKERNWRGRRICVYGGRLETWEKHSLLGFNVFDRHGSHGEPSVIRWAFTPLVPAARWRCGLSDVFSPLLPLAALSLSSSPPLPLLVWPSLAGHGVAAVRVPLHVADAPHRLELRAASAVLVKVSVFALFQQELAATVSGVLIAHPAAETRVHSLVYRFSILIIYVGGRTHVPQLTMMLPTLSVNP